MAEGPIQTSLTWRSDEAHPAFAGGYALNSLRVSRPLEMTLRGRKWKPDRMDSRAGSRAQICVSLQLEHLLVRAIECHQVFVSATFDKPALMHDQDAVGKICG